MNPVSGNMVIIEGDKETKAWLVQGSDQVDDWLYELSDETSFFAAGRLRSRAPGRIEGLVDVNPSNEFEPGFFEAIAGVEPDITEETFSRGLGSDPADYPVYVEVGTGIFGEFGTPIESIPGHIMGPFENQWGEMVFARRIAGQPGQHYARESFEDTVGWLPGRIEIGLRDLARRTE